MRSLLASTVVPLLLLLSLCLVPSHSALVQWLPLQGSYVNYANSSATPIPHGSTSCYGFQTVAGTTAWTQTCGAGNPGTLAMAAYPGEVGDFTVAFYTYIQAFPQETVFFLSCNSFLGNAVDCAELYYDSVYQILVTRLNNQGAGNGLHYPIAAQKWTHMAVTYSQSGQLLNVYINGVAAISNFAVSHSTSVYGAPVIGGEGDSNANNPVQAAFTNFRQYTTVLTQPQIAALATTDAPGYTGAISTAMAGGGGGAAPSPTSAPKAAATSAPVTTPTPTSAPAVAPVQGLVAYLPLQGSYTNAVTASNTPVPHGSTSCYGFQTVAGTTAWTQTCGAGNPGTLSLSATPTESGDFTVAFYVYVQAFPQETVFLPVLQQLR